MKFSNVKCYYTGGGIWVYSAKYGDVWLYGSLDQYITVLKYQGEKLYDDQDVLDYYGEVNDLGEIDNPDDYILTDNDLYPTWAEVLESIRNTDNEGKNWIQEIEEIIRMSTGNDLSKKTNED